MKTSLFSVSNTSFLPLTLRRVCGFLFRFALFSRGGRLCANISNFLASFSDHFVFIAISCWNAFVIHVHCTSICVPEMYSWKLSSVDHLSHLSTSSLSPARHPTSKPHTSFLSSRVGGCITGWQARACPGVPGAGQSGLFILFVRWTTFVTKRKWVFVLMSWAFDREENLFSTTAASLLARQSRSKTRAQPSRGWGPLGTEGC